MPTTDPSYAIIEYVSWGAGPLAKVSCSSIFACFSFFLPLRFLSFSFFDPHCEIYLAMAKYSEPHRVQANYVYLGRERHRPANRGYRIMRRE